MSELEYIQHGDILLYFSEVYKTIIIYTNAEYGITAKCNLTDPNNYRVNFTPKMPVNQFEIDELTWKKEE